MKRGMASSVLAAMLLSGFLACSKPLVKQGEQIHAQSRKEAAASVSVENIALFEHARADSVVVVRFDTVTREKTSIRYYGIERTKTDTLLRTETVAIAKTDTLWQSEKIHERSEPGFFDKLKWILLGIAVGAIGMEVLSLGRKLWKRT